ncbi:MAG TPA: CsbD family protein [Candidatus Binatia bacterium]|nr:CsbD family protein [Candidatus Binatia bacterium]
MNWDVIKGRWEQLKGDARKQWGKLTDDDWNVIAGEKDKFIGKLRERYGWSKDDAERSADEYFSRKS